MGSSGGTGEALRHGLLQRSQHAGQRKVGSDQSWKTKQQTNTEKGEKKERKREKDKVRFQHQPPVLKPTNACSDQGPHPRAHWDGKGCVTEEMGSVGALEEAPLKLRIRSSLAQGSKAKPSTKPFTHGKEAENGTSQAHLEPKQPLGTAHIRLVCALTGTPVLVTQLQGLDSLCAYM